MLVELLVTSPAAVVTAVVVGFLALGSMALGGADA